MMVISRVFCLNRWWRRLQVINHLVREGTGKQKHNMSREHSVLEAALSPFSLPPLFFLSTLLAISTDFLLIPLNQHWVMCYK